MTAEQHIEAIQKRMEARSLEFQRFLGRAQADIHDATVRVTAENAADIAHILNLHAAQAHADARAH